MMVLSPGKIEIVFKALKTLNVRNPAKFPISVEDNLINFKWEFLFAHLIVVLITQTNCSVATCDDNKIKPVPRISQVCVFVDCEAFGDDFDEHLDGVDCQEEEFCFFDCFAHRLK